MITRKMLITFAMSFVIIGCEGDKSTSPREPELTLLGTYEYSAWTYRIFVQNQIVYLSAGNTGLMIISAVNPDSLSLASVYQAPHQVLATFVTGDYAYLACGYSGLIILDISDPYNPMHVGTYLPSDQPDYYVNSVFVQGDFLYLGSAQCEKIEILDISDPDSPALLSSSGGFLRPGRIVVSRNLAFILSGSRSDTKVHLFIADVSDPYNPDSLGYYLLGSLTTRIPLQVLDNYLYFSSYENPGLNILNISDPSSPTLLGEFDTPGTVRDIFIAGENSYVGLNAYVADGNSGLQIINILLPHNPSITASYDISGYADLIFQENEYIYLVKWDTGLMIFRYAPRIVH